MASVNKVTLLGNVGKDPEIRKTQDGGKIVTFSLATSEAWKDRASGERKEKTEWHRVVCFNDRIGDVVEKYVKKGSKVYLEGQIQTRKWTDQSGAEKFSTEIVIGKFKGELTLLDSRENRSGETGETAAQYASASRGGGRSDPQAPLDSDIPY